MSKTTHRVVVSVAVQQDEKFLMVQEGKRKKRGYWNLPSGRVKQREPLIAAAIREAQEETGYCVQLIGLVGVYTYISPADHHVVRFVFAGKVVGEHTRSQSSVHCDSGNEIMDVAWIPAARVINGSDEKLWLPSLLREVLNDALHRPHIPLSYLKEPDLVMEQEVKNVR